MPNLETANNLMEEIIKTHKHFSHVSLEDYTIFQDFFDKENPSYGNSWTYVTQGVYGTGKNNLGYKYYDGKNLSMVEIYPRVENSNENIMYWVRPMGKDIEAIINGISKEVKDKYGLSTYTKKVFLDQFTNLKSLGFSDALSNPWHSFSHSEDDTFPELIFEREATLEMTKTVGRRRNIRKSLREAMKLEQEFQIVISDKNFDKDSWMVANEYFNSVYPKKKLNISRAEDYYNMIFNNILNERLERKVIYLNQKPYGFYVIENNKLTQTAYVYALITLNKSIRYLSDYLLIYIFNNNSSKFINIGGSEDIGIHNFKLKYKPIQEQQMYWASFN